MCVVCRRNLLAGESYRYWRSRSDQPLGRIVCFLCESEAVREGWRRDTRQAGHENATGLRNSVRRVA